MNNEIDNLLGKLCVELGFCLPPKEQKRISSLGFWEASEFAKDVITSEGLNPEYETKWFKEIQNGFIDHFGSNEYESKNSSFKPQGSSPISLTAKAASRLRKRDS